MVAAVASWVDARVHGGAWHVRIDDLDPPREVPGAADDILRTLEGFGLHWEGPVVYQSQRHGAYQEALARLRAQDLLYGCHCSRSDRAGETVYSGTCRERGLSDDRAIRLRMGQGVVQWEDREVGTCRYGLQEDLGDLVLRRADGPWAYALACVVDDAALGVTDVVRGADLLDATAGQIRLQQLLRLPTPRYRHVPVLRNPLGQKWSKQTLAPPVEVAQAPQVLQDVLAWLGLPVVAPAAPAAMLQEVVATLPWRP